MAVGIALIFTAAVSLPARRLGQRPVAASLAYEQSAHSRSGKLTSVRVTIRVRPGSTHDRVGGSHADALIVRVRQRAAHGKATAAALTVLAEALDVPQRDVRLVAGATSRTKIVEIPDVAASSVARLLQDPAAPSDA